jgi:heme/copper-type cytochrome/quinol oxidase subunit 2
MTQTELMRIINQIGSAETVQQMQTQADIMQAIGIIAFVALVLSCIFLFVIMVTLLNKKFYKEEPTKGKKQPRYIDGED